MRTQARGRCTILQKKHDDVARSLEEQKATEDRRVAARAHRLSVKFMQEHMAASEAGSPLPRPPPMPGALPSEYPPDTIPPLNLAGRHRMAREPTHRVLDVIADGWHKLTGFGTPRARVSSPDSRSSERRSSARRSSEDPSYVTDTRTDGLEVSPTPA